MATKWEEKQNAIAAENKKKTSIRAGTGLAVDLVRKAGLQAATGSTSQGAVGVATMAIDIVGTLGIVAWQYNKTKKAQKEKSRKDK